jgi:ubiquinone/menaquinone biosynthesis C-methylase UbiE
MDIAGKSGRKAYKSLPMEGVIANWYARNTECQAAEFEAEARRIAARLRPGAKVLEIAPGPGYLAIALARLGVRPVCGLDISRSFVRIATDNAVRAGVFVDFQLGDAAAMPYADDSFDFIVCRAAFKNFSDPMGALVEMHNVLRPGGEALIIDMRSDATDDAIDTLVDDMKLGLWDAMATRAVFKHSLRKRAYSRSDFQRMAQATPFGAAEIDESAIGLDVWLRKRPCDAV